MRHRDYLERYQQNLLGLHLHDIKGTQDHLAPGTGDFDFSVLKPYIKKTLSKPWRRIIPRAHERLSGPENFRPFLYGWV